MREGSLTKLFPPPPHGHTPIAQYLFLTVILFHTGDQILDVDGVNVGNMTIEQVSEVLKAAPILMTCTVKPASHFKYAAGESAETKKSSYAEIDINALAADALGADPNANNDDDKIEAGYEDDQSSTGSQNYVIMPSDDELENDDDHMYENPSETDDSEYVNVPTNNGERSKNVTSLKAVSPQKADVPAGQRNYLELCFDES